MKLSKAQWWFLWITGILLTPLFFMVGASLESAFIVVLSFLILPILVFLSLKNPSEGIWFIPIKIIIFILVIATIVGSLYILKCFLSYFMGSPSELNKLRESATNSSNNNSAKNIISYVGAFLVLAFISAFPASVIIKWIRNKMNKKSEEKN